MAARRIRSEPRPADTGAAVRDANPSPPRKNGSGRRVRKWTDDPLAAGTPNGIRTPAAALKGRCPRPLDDGAKTRRKPTSSIVAPRGRLVTQARPRPAAGPPPAPGRYGGPGWIRTGDQSTMSRLLYR